jgi:hypothetical protein
MMVPVAKVVRARGVACRFVSLAELRGLSTPDLASRLPGVGVRRALPAWRRDSSAGAGFGTGGGLSAGMRGVAQRAFWSLGLGPRMNRLLRGSSVVAVPNDAAFPFDRLAAMLRVQRIPFALLQEGIRFPLPTEQRKGAPYGGGGARAICAWGEASARHFRSLAANVVRVTGNPRFDDVEPAKWRDQGALLATRLGLEREPLLFLSNTIDDQGFCTTAQKMELFATFLRAAGPVVARDNRAIVVKLHARENVNAFRRVAASVPEARTHVLEDAPLFAALAMARAAVVLASTVGLEALAFGLPLGVLEIPGHGHVFEYVSSGAAIGLRLDELSEGVARLLGCEHDSSASLAFLDSHMAHRGKAAALVADTLLELTQQRTT